MSCPGVDISSFITELTGITNEMVSGKHIDGSSVSEFLKDVDLIIAHNAKFDRAFFEGIGYNDECVCLQ